ncbi:MAG: Smr/MutS family protein [Hyphomonadaceae bacterium]|jgi:DNA-nicking Smr family endonuclease|uniref:Smr/MutS family protein n=1 Tax=Aquidulcibacter sp. TaxID=2052990 RepID=UPI0022CAC294|nr:Smr/MutS family protein [Aquidulcibacter sp.]MCE2890420.1 Smr/MutS family protein [Hyphomonadaceae bacterium]MCZ8206971.1 Smr/MutS family protein [Aquidulcibacter sp.]
MSRRRDLMPDEAKLWHRVARTVRPYGQQRPKLAADDPEQVAVSVPEVVRKPAPELPHLALKRAKAARHVPASPVLRPEAKPESLVSDASGHKKVRRGKLDIDGTIDLHGYRQMDAQTALAGFLVRMRSSGARCVLVVTGKGRAIEIGEDYLTPQPGVIRRRLPEWLSGHGVREHVSGYASAHPRHGGSGAYYVLLKALKDT